MSQPIPWSSAKTPGSTLGQWVARCSSNVAADSILGRFRFEASALNREDSEFEFLQPTVRRYCPDYLSRLCRTSFNSLRNASTS